MSFYIQYTDKLPTKDELYKELVKEAIFKNDTMDQAAAEIGISTRTLYRYTEKMNLSQKEIKNLEVL